MKSIDTFSGVPREALSFLTMPENNNSKTWLESRRNEYESLIPDPSRKFVTATGNRLAGLSPDK